MTTHRSTLPTFTIFERMNSPLVDSRVRWHIVNAVQAENSAEALLTWVANDPFTVSVAPGHEVVTDDDGIPTDCTVVVDELYGFHLMLAWRTDKIDFTHYDGRGRLIEAPNA
jgi:hypothetical protein